MSSVDSSHAMELSVIVPVAGDLLRVEHEAARLLAGIEALDTDDAIEWILVLDGPSWSKAVAPSAWRARGTRRKVVVLDAPVEHVGVLVNYGLCRARGRYVAFLWPGCETDQRLEIWRRLMRLADEEDVALAGGARPLGECRVSPYDSWLPAEEDGLHGFTPGWLEMMSLVPMSNCVLRRDAVDLVGGLSSCAAMQRHAWWDFTLRLARKAEVWEARAPRLECRWGWHNYPWRNPLPVNADMASRLMNSELLPARPPAQGLAISTDGLEAALPDLEPGTRARLLSTLGRNQPSRREIEPRPRALPPGLRERIGWTRPLRVTLLGGLSEPAHNYFCFFTFFLRLAGSGTLSWRTVYDPLATPADIRDADLVIFSRSKRSHARRLMDYCVKHGIPTLFLLNDNWFSLPQDRPEEYADLFSPGRPAFDNFTHCCRQANAVMTQNPLIADDVRPYARRVALIDPAIDLSIFPDATRAPNDALRVGYIGTPRWNEEPFQALVECARRHPCVQVYVMSARLPDALRQLPAKQLTFQRYVFDYRRFADICGRAGLDILLAPLEDNRSQASKCPNKYFDITGVGAAGIYSNLPPYTRFLRDRENGLFVGQGKQAWIDAIETLMASGDLRRRIVKAAREDIARHYSIDAVLPAFIDALNAVVCAQDHAKQESLA